MLLFHHMREKISQKKSSTKNGENVRRSELICQELKWSNREFKNCPRYIFSISLEKFKPQARPGSPQIFQTGQVSQLAPEFHKDYKKKSPIQI